MSYYFSEVPKYPLFSVLVLLVRGQERRCQTIFAAGDRFSDVVAAVRLGYPGWTIAEALF